MTFVQARRFEHKIQKLELELQKLKSKLQQIEIEDDWENDNRVVSLLKKRIAKGKKELFSRKTISSDEFRHRLGI